MRYLILSKAERKLCQKLRGGREMSYRESRRLLDGFRDAVAVRFGIEVAGSGSFEYDRKSGIYAVQYGDYARLVTDDPEILIAGARLLAGRLPLDTGYAGGGYGHGSNILELTRRKEEAQR